MLQFGVIGAGRIGRVHVQNLRAGVDGAAAKTLADPFLTEETAAWALDRGVRQVTKDYRELLADPEIDAVLICSSTDTHAPISLEALAAGKHVFCEKPIDHDPDRIHAVMALAARSGLCYQVGFNRRFDHNYRAVRNAVAEGRIGRPELIKITSRDPEPPPLSYVRVSGGLFMDMMIHDFDMVRYLAGCDAVELFAEAAVLTDPAIGEAGDVDTAVVTLKMENGALAVIDNSRRAVYGYDQRCEVFGSGGMAASGNDRPSTLRLSTADGIRGEKPLWFFLERYTQAYTDELRSFVSAITARTPVEVTANDGLQPVRMALAAQRSLAERRPVRLSEIPE